MSGSRFAIILALTMMIGAMAGAAIAGYTLWYAPVLASWTFVGCEHKIIGLFEVRAHTEMGCFWILVADCSVYGLALGLLIASADLIRQACKGRSDCRG